MAKVPSRPPRTPAQIVEAIDGHAMVVRCAAAELTERILKFEQFLNTLPGRVETWHYMPHPDRDSLDDDKELGIRLHREGKVWILSWGNYIPEIHDFEQPIKWQPLKDAPLKIKIAAVKAFPDLLEAIERSQVVLAKTIEEATAAYDEFAKTLENMVQSHKTKGA